MMKLQFDRREISFFSSFCRQEDFKNWSVITR